MSAAARLALIVVASTMVARSPLPAQSPELPWEDLADALVERMDLQPGESVLLVGRAGNFDPLVHALRTKIAASPATDLGAVDEGGLGFAGDRPTAFARGLSGLEGEELRRALADVDLGVMLPGATPADRIYGTLQERLHDGEGRTIHFHWAGAYGFDGVLLDLDDDIHRTYVRAITETDYPALAAAQRRFEDAARGAPVRVTTPGGTDIRFRIGDRPMTRQDGDASMARAERARTLIDREIELPAGAVRVAPLEESVHGRIAFPPTIWQGVTVEGLVLTIEEGRVTQVEAESGVEAVLAEMEEAGPSGRAFREFALGMNPLLAIPDQGRRWIPYYGYGAGVVRLSLGDNTELGGAVGGGYVRWNFFTDATVTLGDEIWVENGRLVR